MRGEVSYFPHSSSLILEHYAFETCHVTQKMPWNGDADSLTDRYEDYAQMGRYVLFWSKIPISDHFPSCKMCPRSQGLSIGLRAVSFFGSLRRIRTADSL